MKSELQQVLLKKYPEFFDYLKDTKIYTGEKNVHTEIRELLNQKDPVLPIQFGFDCGNGWFMLLDNLMEEIQCHLKNVNNPSKWELKRKWLQKYHIYNLYVWLNKSAKLRFISNFIIDIAPQISKYPCIKIQINQIKEKFGGLCFYYSGGDDEISGMVRFAESLSYKICETCGTTINVGYTEGWIYTCCEDCYDKNPRAVNLKWIKK